MIKPDGVLIVREQIEVTFTEPQRGLIRKLPAITQGRGNLVRRTQYELIGVQMKQSGAFGTAPAAPEMNRGDWQVRIGQKDKFLSGRVTYLIDYIVRGGMTPFEGGEGLGKRTELQWNMLPTNWATTIDNSRVMIMFPTPKPGIVRAKVIVGDLGERKGLEIEPKSGVKQSSTFKAAFVGNTLLTDLLRPLRTGQTMTVTLALPGDTVVAPEPEIAARTDEDGRLLGEEPPQAYFSKQQMIAGTFLPFLPLIPLWFWKRRYQFREGPLVTQFDPPEGIGPSECGLIIDRSFDPRDVVAGILSLAQKGAAKVRPDETETTFSVRLLGLDRGKGLTEFEQGLYRVLEPYGPEIDAATLKGNFGQDYQRLSTSLLQSLHERGLTTTPGMAGFGCGVGLLFAIVTLAAGAFAMENMMGLALCPTIVAIVIGAVMLARMSNLTAEGTRVRSHVKGLREFIQRANADELRRMSETMPAQALFERLLPYALVFGYVEQWSRAFEGIQLQPPEWFESPSGYDYWSMHQINNLLIHDHAWNQAVVPPAPAGSSSWTSGSTSSYDSGSSYSSGDSGFSSSDSGSSSGSGGGGGGGDSW
jgi:uncharacterized membrane protein YgcG